MRFGIDAKWFHCGPPSGMVIVQELCKELVASRECGDELVYLLRSDYRRAPFFPGVSSGARVYTPSIPNFISNAFAFPMLSSRPKLDAVLFQNFVPLYGKTRSVGFVQDLLFVDFPEYFTFSEKCIFRLMQKGLVHASVLVVTSESEKQRMLTLGVEAPIEVVPLGISKAFKVLADYSEAQIEDVRRKYDLPGEFLLYVGRFNIRKNLSGLLAAYRRMNSTIPLVLVGPRDLGQGQGGEYRTLAAGKRIVTTGYVDGADLPLIYAMATVFCFPSFAEGFGLPPLEAMAAGVPVAVSNATSLPEVCGEAARYFDPSDIDAMALEIDGLVSDSSLRKEMIGKGLARSSEFTWGKTSKGILKALRLAAGG